MKNQINISKLKNGQKLWDSRFGEVTFLTTENGIYPILCKKLDGDIRSYTHDGKSFNNDKYPSLFLSNPFEQINEFPKIMEVSAYGDKWSKKTVLAYDESNDVYIAISDKCKSTIIHWKKARELQEPIITEYTIEEIATKLGVDVNLIRIKK
jgi:hypothetical protein